VTDNTEDQFSKLLADSQGDFERDVMSLKGREESQVPATNQEVSTPAPYAAARLMSLEGNNKRVWSSHPKSRMR